MRDTESELFNSEAWLTAAVCLPAACHALACVCSLAPHTLPYYMSCSPLYK